MKRRTFMSAVPLLFAALPAAAATALTVGAIYVGSSERLRLQPVDA